MTSASLRLAQASLGALGIGSPGREDGAKALDVTSDGGVVGEADDRSGRRREARVVYRQHIHVRLPLADARGEDGEVDAAVLNRPVEVVDLPDGAALGGGTIALTDGEDAEVLLFDLSNR